MNQIIDEVYENYLIEDARILPNMSKEKMLELGFRLTKEEFINKIKTDSEFSEMWGLKIEERELNHYERFEIYKNSNIGGRVLQNHITAINFKQFHFDEANIPTKLITITYNRTKIEIYE